MAVNGDMFEVDLLRPAIESILSKADRASISAKGVRKELQALYPGLDIKANKAEVDSLIMDVFSAEDEEGESSDEQPLQSSAPLASSSKIKREVSPAPKKPKVEGTLTDAELARQLSMELNPAPGRTTRHGPVRPKAKAKPKKRAKAVDEYDSNGNIKPKKKAGGGFNKPHLLSDALADVCGETVLSRPGVTKALWKYIKANELQDPNRKTDILPDTKLKRVLPFERINSFTMAKHIGPHLYPYEAKAELVSEVDDDDDDD